MAGERLWVLLHGQQYAGETVGASKATQHDAQISQTRLMSKWVPVQNRIFAKNFYARLANWLIKENCVNFTVRESMGGEEVLRQVLLPIQLHSCGDHWDSLKVVWNFCQTPLQYDHRSDK